MANIITPKYQKLLFITALIVSLDQVTKIVVAKNMVLYETIQVIPGFFNLTYLHNAGGAFGFLADQSQLIRILVFLVFSVLAVCVIFYFYHHTPMKQKILSTGLALIFSGAIGNLIDRIRMGTVVDFLVFYIDSYSWPAFNVADSAITVGMIIFLTHLVLGKMPEQ